jgi:general stress protein 26
MKTDTDLNPSQCIQKLGSLIEGIKIAMVTTVAAKTAASSSQPQELHSCPLTTQQAEFDGDLWFVISQHSQVAQNVESHGAVNVSYASSNGVYVSVSGQAEVIKDRTKLEEFWNAAFKVWFKQGIDDPEIRLLKVHVTSAEYWESPALTVTRLAAFAKAFVTGNPESVQRNTNSCLGNDLEWE